MERFVYALALLGLIVALSGCMLERPVAAQTTETASGTEQASVSATAASSSTGLPTSDSANSMTITRNLRYIERPDSAANLTSLDIYAPAGSSSTAGLPVVVMIHGGGWSIGDKANRELVQYKAPFFTSQGFLFVSINYRLSPAVQHPAHVEDVAAALAWIQAQIGEYGGDPEQLVLIGHSAGAHLAALVAIDQRYLLAAGADPQALRGVVLLDGAGYDIPAQVAATAPRLRNMYLDAFSSDTEAQRDASPATHVHADVPIPAFLIVHVAERAQSGYQSELLAGLLNEAGHSAEVLPVPGATHASLNRDLGLPGDSTSSRVLEFVEAVLD